MKIFEIAEFGLLAFKNVCTVPASLYTPSSQNTNIIIAQILLVAALMTSDQIELQRIFKGLLLIGKAEVLVTTSTPNIKKVFRDSTFFF